MQVGVCTGFWMPQCTTRTTGGVFDCEGRTRGQLGGHGCKVCMCEIPRKIRVRCGCMGQPAATCDMSVLSCDSLYLRLVVIPASITRGASNTAAKVSLTWCNHTTPPTQSRTCKRSHVATLTASLWSHHDTLQQLLSSHTMTCSSSSCCPVTKISCSSCCRATLWSHNDMMQQLLSHQRLLGFCVFLYRPVALPCVHSLPVTEL